MIFLLILGALYGLMHIAVKRAVETYEPDWGYGQKDPCNTI